MPIKKSDVNQNISVSAPMARVAGPTERIPADAVAELKAQVDPDVVDAILDNLDRIDDAIGFDALTDQILQMLIDRSVGGSPFDRVALQRRQLETELIRREVDMFDSVSTFLARATARYGDLTGTADVTDPGRAL